MAREEKAKNQKVKNWNKSWFCLSITAHFWLEVAALDEFAALTLLMLAFLLPVLPSLHGESCFPQLSYPGESHGDRVHSMLSGYAETGCIWDQTMFKESSGSSTPVRASPLEGEILIPVWKEGTLVEGNSGEKSKNLKGVVYRCQSILLLLS